MFFFIFCSRQTYKYLSGLGTNSNIFSVQLNCYTDFVKGIGLVDGKEVRFAESDTIFLTVNKRNKSTNLNPGIALVRY